MSRANLLIILFFLLMISLSAGISDSKSVSADEVVEIIDSGLPVQFDNYTVVGDLNLSGLEIGQPVHFNHTIFQDSVTFNGSSLF